MHVDTKTILLATGPFSRLVEDGVFHEPVRRHVFLDGREILQNEQDTWHVSERNQKLFIKWVYTWIINTLQWRHNDHDSVSNHQPHDCLLNRLFGRRSK